MDQIKVFLISVAWTEPLKLFFAAVAGLATAYGVVIALRNWRNAIIWKREELASSYLAPLLTDEELVFALRCIDWGTGTFPIPNRYLPMFPEKQKTIEHKPMLLAKAMAPTLTEEVRNSPEGMLYRLALDALFTRLEWIGYRTSSKLIRIEDVPDLEYWMKALASWKYGPCSHKSLVFLPFLKWAGYDQTIQLMKEFGIAVPEAELTSTRPPVHDFEQCAFTKSATSKAVVS